MMIPSREDITMSVAEVKGKLRACIYARTSSDDPDHDGSGYSGSDRPSIEEQIKICKELCASKGYALNPKDIFVDMDLSGYTYPEGYSYPDGAAEKYFDDHIRDENRRYRPSAGKMLDRIGATPARDFNYQGLTPAKRRIDVVVVRDVFRICRVPEHGHIDDHFWQIFSRLGVLIHPVGRDPIHADKFSHILSIDLEQRTSTQNQKQQMAASKRSMDAIKNRGGLNTNPDRYGFRPGRRQQVEPVTEELEVVKQIFDMFLNQKLNSTEIAVRLNEEGIPTRWANVWRASHINKLVKLYDSPAATRRKKGLSPAQRQALKEIVERINACGSNKADLRETKRSICAELTEKKVPVIDPPLWNGDRVSHILNKPAYSGQNWSTDGKLIDAAAFDADIKARYPDYEPPVNKKDFDKVINIFRGRSSRPGDVSLVSYARWYEKGGKSTRIGTPTFSHKDRKTIIHPISGLLRCGHCSGMMAPHKTNGNDFFNYKDKNGKTHTGFTVCYYCCKSHRGAPIEDHQLCKGISILERYPEECKAPNPYAQGLPLLEALYPLLFRAYIEHVASEKLLTPARMKERQECMDTLNELGKIERTYFEKFENDILDSEQFDAVMLEKRQQRAELQGRITEINRELEINDLKELPIDLGDLAHPRKMSMELYRALAFRVFKALILHKIPLETKNRKGNTMYRHSLEVVMNGDEAKGDNESFFLHEVRVRRAFRLPWWQAGIDTKKITPQSKLTVAYLNKSTLAGIHSPVNLEYEDSRLTVITVGDNDTLCRRKKPENEEPLSKAYANYFGRGKKRQNVILSSEPISATNQTRPVFF